MALRLLRRGRGKQVMKMDLNIKESFVTPINLLKISKKVWELKKGDVLEITTQDKSTVTYLVKILDLHEVDIETEVEEKTFCYHIKISKK